jgi:hypothetical protein
VKDQEMVKGNMALKVSYDTQMPVRVFRGTLNNKELQYVYEGLYIVKRFERVVRFLHVMYIELSIQKFRLT